MVIRSLLPEDVPAAAAVAEEALPIPDEYRSPDRRAWVEQRIAHLARTDPGGAWIAESDGEVAGVGVALVRDGIWGLSLMAVRTDRHAQGLGGRLLGATLGHADGARAGIIASSTHPRAMRMYARAGFELRPCVTFAGILDRDAIPTRLRARASEDVEAAAALSRPVRGGAYAAADLALLTGRPGRDLLLVEGAGFAIHDEGSPVLLAARDEAAATDLLWACFAAARPGATVHVDFLTAGQDWAIRAGLEARLVLSPDGPLYTRGTLGPLTPWIPSGALL